MSEKVYSTGLQELDKMLNEGLRAHSLLTIGARPSMGKNSSDGNNGFPFNRK